MSPQPSCALTSTIVPSVGNACLSASRARALISISGSPTFRGPETVCRPGLGTKVPKSRGGPRHPPLPAGSYSGDVRISVRVQPRARSTGVGGRYGTADPPVLIVRVREAAVDGRANRACVDALAAALGLPKPAVRIVSGHSSRSKLVDAEGADRRTLSALLDGS